LALVDMAVGQRYRAALAVLAGGVLERNPKF
jgi:hypothetical protein